MQHYATNEPIFPSFFIQNELRNKITVNDLMSALGALKRFHIFDRALIEEGHLLERGAYFKNLKNRNSDFNMRFKIKYQHFVFEKYRIFNIDEHI